MKLFKIFRLNFKFNQSVVGKKDAENEWWAIIEFQSQRWCWWLVSEIFRIKYVIKNTKRTRVSRLGEQSDWAIYWTLGNFLKPLTTINLSKSPTFLSIFCKGVKIYHFSSEIIFRQLLYTFGNFFWSHCSHQSRIYQIVKEFLSVRAIPSCKVVKRFVATKSVVKNHSKKRPKMWHFLFKNNVATFTSF